MRRGGKREAFFVKGLSKEGGERGGMQRRGKKKGGLVRSSNA